MKVLIAGNSQASALFRSSRNTSLSAEVQFYFYVIPGGGGPHFSIEDGYLQALNFNKQYPPYMHPPGTDKIPLAEFDAVVISALGYIDGGFLYRNPIATQGLLSEFGPKQNSHVSALISRSCLREVVREGLERQAGFQFLRNLSTRYDGIVMVQPFPYLSEFVRSHEEWKLRELYDDYVGFSKFLSGIRDDVVADICAQCGADFLGYPDPTIPLEGFTPRHMMRDNDGLHPEGVYGAEVVRQIVERLRA